jgi:hypothetical protein
MRNGGQVTSWSYEWGPVQGALETLHLALPSSGRLMRIFGPIVPPSPALMQAFEAESAGRCAI